MLFVKCSQKTKEWDDGHMRYTNYKAEWRANLKLKGTKFKEKKQEYETGRWSWTGTTYLWNCKEKLKRFVLTEPVQESNEVKTESFSK